MKNIKEIMEALIKGEKIGSYSWDENEYVYLDKDGKLMDEELNEISISELPEAAEAYIWSEPEWHENIPEHGALCWVSHRNPGNRGLVGIVTRYDSYDESYTLKSGDYIKYATPMTKEEMLKFCHGESV